jgi:homospermidine synthase
MTRFEFQGRVLLVGFGGVAQCTLPLIERHLAVPLNRITVMDFAEKASAKILPWKAKGVKFSDERITPENLSTELGKYVGPGDLIIDLAWNIECADILRWCHNHQVLYINTSVELWNPYHEAERKSPQERTLYARHMKLWDLFREWGGNHGTTAVLEHGANPGLVSHFTKRALRDITHRLLSDRPYDPRRTELERALDDRQYGALAYLLGVRVLHISERDTQATNLHRPGNVFFNTWSVEGLFEEGTAPAEMGWGTHERLLPTGSCQHDAGPRNQICLRDFGINTFVKTRVPSAELVGMIIRHGEAFTLSHYLSLQNSDRETIYRPTVHYSYLPCPQAVECLEEVRAKGFKRHDTWHIMGDDITHGYDELGVLLMGHDYKSWWCGTILSIEEARALVPGQNATTLQVAASVLAAVGWMLRNPESGVRVPEELPDDEILEFAQPYLGRVPSIPLDWTPVDSELASTPNAHLDDAVWQFGNFLITEESRDRHGQPIVGPQLVREFLNPLQLR